jgi:CheY-like chemotaxis protein
MSKRILVVEDQPDNRQIIRDMLQRALDWPTLFPV